MSQLNQEIENLAQSILQLEAAIEDRLSVESNKQADLFEKMVTLDNKNAKVKDGLNTAIDKIETLLQE